MWLVGFALDAENHCFLGFQVQHRNWYGCRALGRRSTRAWEDDGTTKANGSHPV